MISFVLHFRFLLLPLHSLKLNILNLTCADSGQKSLILRQDGFKDRWKLGRKKAKLQSSTVYAAARNNRFCNIQQFTREHVLNSLQCIIKELGHCRGEQKDVLQPQK